MVFMVIWSNKGIIVRNRSKVELCEGCLRITVGTRFRKPHYYFKLYKLIK